MNTIIHITDNSLREDIASFCRKTLVDAACDNPIVSVSQKPIDLGTNIVVGEIGRNWKSFYSQILTALDAVKTETIAIAEHDCLYTQEALSFIPDDLSVFWYNSNHLLVQWPGTHENKEFDGMYSHWPKRLPFSQLVCDRELLKKSILEIINLIEAGLKLDKGQRWFAEPGVIDGNLKKAAAAAISGTATQLQRYLKEYVTKYSHKIFKTKYSSLDIRHGGNYTGAKRGKNRTWEVPYWGRFEDFINKNSKLSVGA